MSFAMSPAARERLDAVRASPLYPQIQAMNRRLNEMSKQNNYRDPVGNPEYDQLKSELFALQDKAAGGSPTPNMSQPPPFGGGLGGLLSRFDPRRMGGGFGGMFRRPLPFNPFGGGQFGGMFRRPLPFNPFGGGQFGGRRPFPGMYRGMPTFMNRMRPPFFDRRQKRPFFGLNRRPPFGGGFRPPFFQRSRPPYNPMPQIDPDAFRQFRRRVDQPITGTLGTEGGLTSAPEPITDRAEPSRFETMVNTLRESGVAPNAQYLGKFQPSSQVGGRAFDDPLRGTPAKVGGLVDPTLFGGTQTFPGSAPQIPQELIDAQMSSVQQGPPVAGGTGSLYGTPASQEEIDRMQTRMGGLASISGMMGATGGRAAPYSQPVPHTPIGQIARMSPEVIAQAKAKRMMMERR